MKRPSKKHIHTFKVGDRVTTLVLSEQPDRILIEQYVNYPNPDVDREAFTKWALPILLPYENDRRPQVWRNMQTGEECVIHDLR